MPARRRRYLMEAFCSVGRHPASRWTAPFAGSYYLLYGIYLETGVGFRASGGCGSMSSPATSTGVNYEYVSSAGGRVVRIRHRLPLLQCIYCSQGVVVGRSPHHAGTYVSRWSQLRGLSALGAFRAPLCRNCRSRTASRANAGGPIWLRARILMA